MKSCSTLFPSVIRPGTFLILFFGILLCAANGVHAQVLIDPAGAGGFQSGTSFASNGWSVDNGSVTNKWYVGTVPTGFTGRAAYISNDGGLSHTYTNTSQISVVHFWRDVTFPAGESRFQLTFSWKGDGEVSSFDALMVSLAPTYYTPVASATSLGTSGLAAPAQTLVQLWDAGSVQTANITIYGSDLGNCSGPVTRRLIFTWKNDDSLGNDPPAGIDNISLSVLPMTLNDPADRCTDGADMTFTATPAPNAQPGATGTFSILPQPGLGAFTDNGNGTANLDVSASNAGIYTVYYRYEAEGCTYEISRQVELFPAPVARLKETLLNCYDAGNTVDLSTMFDGANTPGGTWTISPAATLTGSTLTVPAGGGCFNVTYTLTNPNACTNAPYSDTEELLITIDPQPAFTITGNTSPVCSDGGTVPVTITRTSTGSNPVLTINGVAAAVGVNNLAAPATVGSIVYNICLTETNNAPAACGSTLPGAGYTPCSSVYCTTFTVYNDGAGCGANAAFASECPPDESFSDPCTISVNNEMVFSCKFFSLPGLQIIEAKLDAEEGVIFCDDEEVCLEWQGSLPGALGDAITGGPTLAELGGPATEAICFIINFEICIPLPIVPDICIDPLPLPQFIEDACDQTIGQFIFSALSELIGGDGGGGLIVADTDGDGAFDLVLEDYENFPDEGEVCVPNNVDKPQGTITVRHVTGWPFKPASACGVVTGESVDLLELLPIGAIPLIGGPIEDILATAGCGIDLVYSDEKTVEIPVVNNTPPAFANCNTSGYIFSEDLICDTEVDWSIPVAYDGCRGGILPYRGRTAGTDATNYNGAAPPVVVVTESGIYQTAGPIPGSDLDPGNYSVTYTAYSCSGVESTCTFPLVVTSGDPVLACPNDLTVNTDVDVCEAVVTGLTPIQGVGCSSIINYSVDYPSNSGFVDIFTNTPFSQANLGTHNDASGLPFPHGTTTVTYTMVVDINGDGDVTDPGETQTCSFTITVEDHQKPKALCIDREVKLNNAGSVTVYAVDQADGTPYVNGGSFDNCDAAPVIEIAKPGQPFSPSVSYDCSQTDNNFVNLRVTDADGNFSICLANIKVNDFFDGIQLALDAPEICIQANNPVQLDFANYLTITLPNGQTITHSQVAANTYLGDAVGAFGITAFAPHPGSVSVDPGTITTDGVYTPGTGTGYVTISYVMAMPGTFIPQNGNMALAGCLVMVHETFELRQPLNMGSPECMCFDGEERIVDLGVITGGLEPYTIQYSGTRLDVNGDGISDDADGQYVYDVAHGHNINDFSQDLGELRVVYTQPTWSFTIVDARGCELFRSGSCDNDDLTEGPNIPCTKPQVELNTEPFLCESQYTWQHPLPTDNCAVVLYDYRIINPDGTIDGPHTLNGLLNIAPGAPVPALFTATYEFQLGISVVSYYAEDAQGNFTTCTFTVHVIDDDPPYFLNCPYPDVVQDAEPDQCDAYVNFALPLATDNCDMPPVTQIDLTGYETGDRFPVGLTVLYYEAIDLSGNKDTCRVKVIVNDYGRIPSLTCPGNKEVPNDPWICGAEVENIAPVFDGPCKKNFAVTYSIYADAALTQRKECGVWDASGELFDKGDSWVKYTVRSQPLLLITEVSQSGPVDRLEITNLGPAALDITCLMVSRTSTNPAANENIPPVSQLPSLAPTIVPVGGVYVFNFAFNGAANMPACYTVAFKGNLIDEVAVNSAAACGNFTGTLAGGDVIRMCEDDSDNAADWSLAQLCSPLSIGVLNPGLDIMPNNGTQTSLQSIVPNRNTCTFKVRVNDVEDPFCGKLDGVTTYNGGPVVGINPNACNQSTTTVPPSNDCIIGNVVFSLTGTATPANSKITLISPKGIRVTINELPKDTFPELFAQKAAGVWTLDIIPLVGTPTVTGWTLQITCLDTFDMADQVKPNDPGQCGANFTWKHPYFVDNCFDGTISVAYTTNDADCVPTGGLLLGKGGYVVTKFFCVGTTKVTYTLVDASGNTEQCDFDVTINDVEKPVVVCPQDITVHLAGGECGAFVNYQPVFTSDNCKVTDTLMTPPSGSWFIIGTHVVVITVFDEAGNTQTCTFKVNIIEHVPTSGVLVCNDLEHISLDSTCVYVVNADAALEGDDYHCYDDYIIIIKNNLGQMVGNTFNASNIGKTYIVTVLDPETGNSCWTNMKIEDKLAPALTCPPAVTISCSESTAVAHTGNVLAKDCTATSTQTELNIIDNGECGDPRQIITRTFIVTDAWGNQASCNQTITVEKFDFADLQFPADITINCENTYLNPLATAPVSTGRPSINGAPIGAGGLCSTSIGYWDEKLDICFGSYEIFRTWKVANTCLPLGPNNPVEHTQRIRIKDFGGPQFACPGDVTVSVDPNICCATAALPDMIITEGCSGIVSLEARVSGIDPSGNYITFTVPGYLADFPGNNYWNADTLAKFSYTQCLPQGTYTVRYTAKDGCENISICEFAMTIADLVPPIVACDEWTQVALGIDGMAFVNATTYDDGSLDNCGPVYFKARRMAANTCDSTSVFKNQVKFCCSDIGDTLTVVLRVYDVNPGAGNVGLEDFEGHYNDCMVQTLVEDKIKPTCSAPANVTVSCEAFDPSLWAYGTATATDNCCIDTITYQVVLTNFDSLCNRGTITRRWTAVDCGGNTSQCTQRIISTYNQDYYVKFPADRIISTCDGTGVYGAPEFYGENCELLATSFVDEIFTVVPDACFKIERTWTVINWCTYTPNAPCNYVPNPNPSNTTNAPANLAGVTVSAPGTTILNWNPTVVKINPTDPTPTNYSIFWSANANCYQYKQIIKIFDTQDPEVVTPTDSLFCDYSANDGQFWNASYWWDAAISSHDLCEGDANIELTATDACSGALLNFRYLLFIDLDNNGTMETVINSVTPPGFNNVQFNNYQTANYLGGEPRQFDFRPVPGTQKWGFGLQVDAAVGANRAARVRWFNQLGQNAVPQLPYGKHKIKWFIEDGCGNETIIDKPFEVKDCKKPTVVCINGLSVNMMNVTPPMIQLWASDFLQYAEDNCTPANQLKIGIRRSGTGTGFPTNPDGTPQTGVQFTCADLGTQLVELWAIDKAGNADFCETYVLIQDNTGACGNGSTAIVAGSILTEAAEGVQDATIEMEGVSNGLPSFGAVFTNVSGDYAFSGGLPFGSDYTVTPTMELDPLNGLNTWDLVLISRHILGLEPLNTPYKLIAADANKSGTITTFDVVELRKLILGTYTELPNNSSWRFIDKAQVFTDLNNPFVDVIKENISVAQVQASAWNDDFVAAKIGDVDNSATPNTLVSTDDRTTGTLLFDIDDREVRAGETFAVTLKADQIVKGYQFTMNLTNLEVVNIVPGAKMSMDNFGIFANAVTTSADGADGEFTVNFRAKAGGQLSRMISVSSRITKAVAFDATASKMDVAFRFNNGSTSTIAGIGFELYQNTPNPWISKTQIGFHLPEATHATLTIYDGTGRTMYTAEGDFAKGYNAFSVDNKLVDNTGALYYKVETALGSGVRQMVELR